MTHGLGKGLVPRRPDNVRARAGASQAPSGAALELPLPQHLSGAQNGHVIALW